VGKKLQFLIAALETGK